MKTELREAMEKQRKVLLLLWSSFMGTVVILLAIPHWVRPPLPSGDYGPDFLRTVLWIIVIAKTAFLWWWNRAFLSKEAALKEAARFRSLSETQAIASYAAKRITAFALAESIAIYGFVLAFVKQAMGDQYPMTLLSVLWLIYLYPSAGFFEEVARELEDRGVSPTQ